MDKLYQNYSIELLFLLIVVYFYLAITLIPKAKCSLTGALNRFSISMAIPLRLHALNTSTSIKMAV
ncbi:MAG: hypothetical protein ITF98_06930 [Fermentimonas sp.]|nr:hypothetical protein [Fermentimonas sp.]